MSIYDQSHTRESILNAQLTGEEKKCLEKVAKSAFVFLTENMQEVDEGFWKFMYRIEGDSELYSHEEALTAKCHEIGKNVFHKKYNNYKRG